MSSWLYFASATQPLRCSTNLSSGIYLASATTPLRYGTNLPLGVYLAPEAPPLRHTLIAVARARTRGNRVVGPDGGDASKAARFMSWRPVDGGFFERAWISEVEPC
jgi:hypothetical protein